MPTMKEKALALARKGFAVFPLQPNSKKPLAGSAGFKDATTNDFEIEAWWTEHPDANIGLYPDACKPRLLIVDVDIKKGGGETAERLCIEGVFPSTMAIRTPSGGAHYYYTLADDAAPVASSVEKLGKGVDVRAHGGYVVAPGSVIDGKPYRIIPHTKPNGFFPAPDTLIEACGRVEERHPEAERWIVEPDLSINVDHARDWLKQTEPAVEHGGGDNWTIATAAMLRDRGISEAMALELMLEVWNPRCMPRPWPADMLEVKVANAYKSAKRPAGCEAWSRKAEALQGSTAVVEPATEPAKRRPYRPVTVKTLDTRTPPEWLVDEVFPMIGLGEILGATGTYKSFLALDLCLHVAYGLPWMGRPTRQASVVYVAGEGSAGIRARVKAWMIHHDIKENPENFYLVEAMPPFSELGEVREFLEEIAHIKPGLIILDTLARAIPGLDENSAKDLGLFVRAADQIWQGLQCFIVYLHHTGKDEKKGSRGSTAGPAALETQLTVTSNPAIREAYLRMTKGKDVEVWPESHVFKGHRIDLSPLGLKTSLAFAHSGVREAGEGHGSEGDDQSTRAISAARWEALRGVLAGREVNRALTNRLLAEAIAQATTSDDDWPEEGEVREDLTAGAIRFLAETVATSNEGKKWMLDPSAAAKNRRWRDPEA